MNINHKSLVATSLLFIAPIIAPVSIITITTATSGCKTSERTIAYKSIASLHVAVSSALAAWADYVVAERDRIGVMPQSSERVAADSSLALKEVRVRAALERYKQAGELAKVGIKISNADNPAPPPMPFLRAGEDFVSTVSQLTK